MTTKYALNQGLAVLAIFGDIHGHGIHINTRIAMSDHYTREPYNVTIGEETFELHRYKLTEDGWSRVRQSRLWKAHQHLLSLGYRVESRRGRCYTPRHISYIESDDPKTGRTAFTGGHGRVYMQADSRRFSHEMTAEFRNGEER